MMNRNRTILLGGALLTFVAIIVWILVRNRRLEQPITSSQPVSSASQNTVVQTIQLESEIRKAVQVQNAPMNFWGKVIDQDSAALVGVRIRLEARKWVALPLGSPTGTFKYFERRTDQNGCFDLTNVEGDTLSIQSITQEGYELSPKVRTTGLSDRSTSPQNPLIFRMWKKGPKQTLSCHRITDGIPCDGVPIHFDLRKGEKVPSGGDLQVSLRREPLHIQRGKPFTWKLTIEAIDGGLLETTDEFMYRAPEGGYQPKVEYMMPANDPSWTALKRVFFYAKSQHGNHYARVDFELVADFEPPPTCITIVSCLNATGSRNLE